jgi:hypothetical protein
MAEGVGNMGEGVVINFVCGGKEEEIRGEAKQS